MLGLLLSASFSLPAQAGPPAGPILRGPLLCSPAPHSIAIWVQGSRPMRLRLRAVPSAQECWKNSLLSGFIQLKPEKRLIGVFHLEGLKADTSYRYRIENEEGPVFSGEESVFRTPPETGQGTRLRFAAGSGANSWIEPEPDVWEAIADDGPDLFVALGDTPYADGQLWLESQAWEQARERAREDKSPENLARLDETAALFRRKAKEAIPLAYEYFRDAPDLSRMSSRSFWVATWDDHDTGINNGDAENPVTAIALENFRAFTPNPAFGLPDAPGAFWVLHWGDIDLFLLDDQSYRSPTTESLADPDHATILGETQLRWLLDGLRNSKAVFKIVVSGSPFNDFSRKDDAWVSYPEERQRFIDGIAASKIDGVLLLSGDVHRSEIFHLPWLQEAGGYPLVEVVASPLFQKSRKCGPTVPDRVFCTGSRHHEIRQLYAWFDADTRGKDPSITVEIRGLEDEVFYSETLHASQLRWNNTQEGQQK